MVKSSKNRSKKNATRKNMNYCKNKTTTHGLHEWHKHVFEHLGWMVLLKAKGEAPYKVSAYKQSLHLLEEKLECKIATIHDSDKKEDLEVLLENVNILIKHANKDL